MGYTHYWDRKKPDIPLTLWHRAVEQIRPIIEANKGVLSDIDISDEWIFFNGQCETFIVQRCFKSDYPQMREGGHFDFCKTRQREYDPVVVACLLIFDYVLADDPVGFHWNSDGDWPQEHAGGIELAGIPFDDMKGPRDE